MKIRIFENMDNSVFRVVANTEDFSQDDLKLMCQYGEPEINAGGEVDYVLAGETKSKTFGDQYVRILHGFPLSFGFDSRDYDGSLEESTAVGNAWKEALKAKIGEAMSALRAKSGPLPTEEVVNV